MAAELPLLVAAVTQRLAVALRAEVGGEGRAGRAHRTGDAVGGMPCPGAASCGPWQFSHWMLPSWATSGHMLRVWVQVVGSWALIKPELTQSS